VKIFKLNEMKGGWFIGNFNPTLLETSDVEVAVKNYQKGDYEKKHFHKIATEYTVIVSGDVKMNDNYYTAGDIIRIDPGEATDFLVLSEVAVTTVVKVPCISDDKFLAEE
jgi:anti-sigma factor ChrR (cupin superfamily)